MRERFPEAVPAGSPLDLEVSAGGATVEVTGNVPEAPVLTAPATGTVFALTDFITVTWTSVTDPDRFDVNLSSVFPFSVFPAPGTAREMKLAVRDLGWVGSDRISVSAIIAGSFAGPADPGSRVTIVGEGPPNPVITIRR